MTELTSKLLSETPAETRDYYVVFSKKGTLLSMKLMTREDAEGMAIQRGGVLAKAQFAPEEAEPDIRGVTYRNLRSALKAFKPENTNYLWVGGSPGKGRTSISIEATEASFAAFGFNAAQATAAWQEFDKKRRDEAKRGLDLSQRNGDDMLIRANQRWLNEPASMRIQILFNPVGGTYKAELKRQTEGGVSEIPNMKTQGRIEDALAILQAK